MVIQYSELGHNSQYPYRFEEVPSQRLGMSISTEVDYAQLDFSKTRLS